MHGPGTIPDSCWSDSPAFLHISAWAAAGWSHRLGYRSSHRSLLPSTFICLFLEEFCGLCLLKFYLRLTRSLCRMSLLGSVGTISMASASWAMLTSFAGHMDFIPWFGFVFSPPCPKAEGKHLSQREESAWGLRPETLRFPCQMRSRRTLTKTNLLQKMSCYAGKSLCRNPSVSVLRSWLAFIF